MLTPGRIAEGHLAIGETSYNRDMPQPKPTPISRTPAVCRGCTLCCDDVEVARTGGQLVFSEKFCERGRVWFQQQAEAERDSSAGGVRVGGQAAGRTEALPAAAKLLRAARRPLICGLTSLSLAQQQALVQLGQKVGAVVDFDWQEPQLGNSAALQQTGRMTATLGQVAAQADLHLLLEAAPERTHPRLGERLGWAAQPGWRFRTRALLAESDWLGAAQPRTEVVCRDVDELNDLVWWLRALVRAIGDPAGQCPPQWRESLEHLVAAARTARGVALIGGSELARHSDLALQVHQLARELNELGKTWLLLAGEDDNAAGAESVLTWSTGFPRSIDLRPIALGSEQVGGTELFHCAAQWNREEYSAARLLARNESDLVVCCVTARDRDAWLNLPTGLQETLLRLPRVIFYSSEHPLVAGADVAIPMAQVGWDDSGEVVRLDELTLTAPQLVASARSGLEEWVRALLEELP